jgi:hypothetical protein
VLAWNHDLAVKHGFIGRQERPVDSDRREASRPVVAAECRWSPALAQVQLRRLAVMLDIEELRSR